MMPMVMIQLDVAVLVDPEDTGDAVVVIVVARGDILGMLGTIEDSPGGVVKDGINNRLGLKVF